MRYYLFALLKQFEMNKCVYLFFPPIFCSWYREGSQIPLTAPISRGGSKDRQTTSTLSITPQREDDGAKYRCVVWNRAMAEGQRLETTVTLNVNCKYHFYSSRLYSRKKREKKLV